MSESLLPKEIILRDILGREVIRIETDSTLTVTADVHFLLNEFYFVDFGTGKFERIIINR